MANSFTQLTATVDRLADEVQAVGDAIRSPAQDNNDQAQIDALAGRLDAAANSLREATDAENLEDAGTSSVDSANNNPDTPAPPAEEAPAETPA